MARAKDLTGQKFGRLTVVKDSGKRCRRNVVWLCKCDCGNNVEVIGSNLTGERTQSCGCLQKDEVRQSGKNNIKDLTNIKFGKLTVVERVGTDKYRNALWLCKCDCGNTCIVCGTSLINNKTKSCGCYKIESNIGENNPNYNYNLTDEEREHNRKTKEYSEWVYDVKEQFDFTCDCCSNKGGNLVSHHKDSYNSCQERRLDPTNGVCLCESCHKEFHHIYGYGDNTEEQYVEFKKQKSTQK